MSNFRCSGIGYYQKTGYVCASADELMMGFRSHNILDNFVVDDKMGQKPTRDGKRSICSAKSAKTIGEQANAGVVP